MVDWHLTKGQVRLFENLNHGPVRVEHGIDDLEVVVQHCVEAPVWKPNRHFPRTAAHPLKQADAACWLILQGLGPDDIDLGLVSAS